MQAQKCHFRSGRDERERRRTEGEGAGEQRWMGGWKRPWNNCLNHDRKMTTAWRGFCVFVHARRGMLKSALVCGVYGFRLFFFFFSWCEHVIRLHIRRSRSLRESRIDKSVCLCENAKIQRSVCIICTVSLQVHQTCGTNVCLCFSPYV